MIKHDSFIWRFLDKTLSFWHNSSYLFVCFFDYSLYLCFNLCCIQVPCENVFSRATIKELRAECKKKKKRLVKCECGELNHASYDTGSKWRSHGGIWNMAIASSYEYKMNIITLRCKTVYCSGNRTEHLIGIHFF